MQVETPDPNTLDILLVEDDAGVRRSILMLLKAHGFHVRAYGLGNALLLDPSALAARLLIADWQMPDMDGFEVLSSLRAKDWHGSAIMLTGYDNETLADKAENSGFQRLLRKPVIDHELIGTVKRLLGQQPGSRNLDRDLSTFCATKS